MNPLDKECNVLRVRFDEKIIETECVFFILFPTSFKTFLPRNCESLKRQLDSNERKKLLWNEKLRVSFHFEISFDNFAQKTVFSSFLSSSKKTSMNQSNVPEVILHFCFPDFGFSTWLRLLSKSVDYSSQDKRWLTAHPSWLRYCGALT